MLVGKFRRILCKYVFSNTVILLFVFSYIFAVIVISIADVDKQKFIGSRIQFYNNGSYSIVSAGEQFVDSQANPLAGHQSIEHVHLQISRSNIKFLTMPTPFVHLTTKIIRNDTNTSGVSSDEIREYYLKSKCDEISTLVMIRKNDACSLVKNGQIVIVKWNIVLAYICYFVLFAIIVFVAYKKSYDRWRREAKSANRCCYCAYDLSGLSKCYDKCPECGKTI